MRTDKDDRLGNDSDNQPSAPLFAGRLTKMRLMTLPDNFFLISNVAPTPFTPALEVEVTKETSREALWRLIVDRRLNGRTFSAFRDKEGLQAEKDRRLKFSPGPTGIQ
jgi:hypothetical protein